MSITTKVVFGEVIGFRSPDISTETLLKVGVLHSQPTWKIILEQKGVIFKIIKIQLIHDNINKTVLI